MKLLLSLFFCTSLWANSCTYTGAGGNWTTLVWGTCGGTYPHNGDTATLTISGNVTVDTALIVGTSDVTDTAAITIQNGSTGAITVPTNGSLTLRGSLLDRVNVTAGTFFTAAAGSTITFDSTLAVSPTSTYYRIGNGVGNGWRGMQFNGTTPAGLQVLGSCATCVKVTSTPTGAGHLGIDYAGAIPGNGPVFARWTQFTNLGDATHDGASQYDNGAGPWDVRYSWIDSSGLFPRMIHMAVSFDARYNIYTNSKDTGRATACGCGSSAISSLEVQTGTGAPAGAFNIIGNYLDQALWGHSGMQGAVITDNSFLGGVVNNPGFLWTSFTRNFVREPTGQALEISSPGMSYVSFIHDTETGRHHMDLYHPSANVSVSNVATEVTTVPRYNADGPNDGDSLLMSDAVITPGVQINADHIVYVPSPTMFPTGTAYLTVIGDHPNTTTELNHLTFLTGSTGVDDPGMVIYAEGQTNGQAIQTGQAGRLENSLTWDTGPNSPMAWEWNQGGDVSWLQPDILAYADYNRKFNVGSYQNLSGAGCGYSMVLSHTPCTAGGYGVHDTTGDPQFLDRYRGLYLVDTRMLGHSLSTPWQSGHSYTVGQQVSMSDPTIYGGLYGINFTCVQANTSDSTNEPVFGPLGVGAFVQSPWRSYWVASSVSDFLTMAAYYQSNTGTLTPAEIFRQWVFAGFRPQDPTLAAAGNDGHSPGAVDYSATVKATSYLNVGP